MHVETDPAVSSQASDPCCWSQEERQRLLEDKQALLEENVQLRRELLNLQKDHIAILQLYYALQQQQQEQQHQQQQPATPSEQQEPQLEPSAPRQQHSHCHHHNGHQLRHRQSVGNSSRPPLLQRGDPSIISNAGAASRDSSMNSSPFYAAAKPPFRQPTRTRLHSSIQRLGALLAPRKSWVLLNRSSSKSTSSQFGELPDGPDSSSSIGSKAVVDVGQLTGLSRTASDGLPLQLRASISGSISCVSYDRNNTGNNNSKSRDGLGFLSSSMSGAIWHQQQQLLLQQQLPNSGAGISAAWSAAGAGSSKSGWRCRRPAPLTYLHPTLSTPPSAVATPVTASSSAQLAAVAAAAAGRGSGVGCWELQEPLSCPPATMCETPCFTPQDRHYSSSTSSSGTSGSSGSSSCSSASSSSNGLVLATLTHADDMRVPPAAAAAAVLDAAAEAADVAALTAAWDASSDSRHGCSLQGTSVACRETGTGTGTGIAAAAAACAAANRMHVPVVTGGMASGPLMLPPLGVKHLSSSNNSSNSNSSGFVPMLSSSTSSSISSNSSSSSWSRMSDNPAVGMQLKSAMISLNVLSTHSNAVPAATAAAAAAVHDVVDLLSSRSDVAGAMEVSDSAGFGCDASPTASCSAASTPTWGVDMGALCKVQQCVPDTAAKGLRLDSQQLA